MTAAALLVVLGAALAMQITGLSMAMGAFLAGVLLSESTFRHQLEADIEPFRGILLGLFFLSVGMSLDLALIARAWPLIVSGVLAFMGAKALGIYIVARLFRASHRNGLYRATLFAQGGEFAFVLYAAATNGGIFDPSTNAMLTAAIILSMALTPLAVFALRWLIPPDEQSLDGVDVPDGLKASVLIIGFGRFGQVASQSLLARGIDVSIIDRDTEMIRSAADFGFKIYYGDGTRLDLLHAAGAGKAVAIAICVEDRNATDRIVELVKAEFPLVRLLVRSYRPRARAETCGHGMWTTKSAKHSNSAMAFGEAALRQLGVTEDEAAEISQEIRRRDAERYALELAGGLMAGADMMHGNVPKPTPFTTPKKKTASPSQAEATMAADRDG